MSVSVRAAAAQVPSTAGHTRFPPPWRTSQSARAFRASPRACPPFSAPNAGTNSRRIRCESIAAKRRQGRRHYHPCHYLVRTPLGQALTSTLSRDGSIPYT